MNNYNDLIRSSYSYIELNKTRDDLIKDIDMIYLKYLDLFKFNQELQFGIDSYSINYLIKGFSSPEGDHIWTDKEEAEIRIPIQTTNSDLRLTIRGIKLTSSQTIKFVINDRVYGNLENGNNEFIILADELLNQNYLNIKIITSKLYTPIELGIGRDPRTLGFSLQAIGLYENNSED
jgi:hypothetical protein